VDRWNQGNENRRGPTEQENQRMSEELPDRANAGLDAHSPRERAKRAGEEDGEEQERDAKDLALE
jgi:hypothetical protein